MGPTRVSRSGLGQSPPLAASVRAGGCALLALAAALAGFASTAGRAQAPTAPMPVNPAVMAKLDARTAHAKAMAGELVLVDIRSQDEWRETGIPASAHAVTLDQKPQDLVAALSHLVGGDKTKPLAVICATGSRSAFLAGQLARIGHTQVSDVAEGVVGGRNGLGWVKSGLPLRPGAEAAQPPRIGAAAPTQPESRKP